MSSSASPSETRRPNEAWLEAIGRLISRCSHEQRSEFRLDIQWPRRKVSRRRFLSLALAEDWIRKHQLSGVLTNYPVDVGVFEWAIANGMFTPKDERQKSAEFVGRFSSASQEHWHYEDGEKA